MEGELSSGKADRYGVGRKEGMGSARVSWVTCGPS